MNTHQSFDRESFQSLLANAFSVQQSGMAPESLAAIIEIQRVVTGDGVDAGYAMNLLAERARGVAGASGIGIAVLEGNQLVHRAGSGTALENVGSQLTAVFSSAAHDHPRKEILRVENAATDSRIEGEICRQFDVEALLMVPIYREHAMIGVLEVFFNEPHVFSEPEVRTYQLMATLAGDASALPLVTAEKSIVSSSTLARALLRMNQQVRQLTVTRQRAPEVPTEARAESSYTQILSAVRKWDARAYGAQLAGSAAEHLRHIRLPKWQLPHARRPRLSWHKPALERLHQELLLFQAQWPSWSRGKLLLNVAAVSVVLVLAIMAAIARHQSTILPVADSSSGNTTPVPAQPLSAVDQQIVAPPPLKPNASASARDAGAPTASFKRVWAGKDEVDYISDDVTIRHFRPLPTPKKSSAWNKQVNIGKDVTVRYFNSPRLPTAEPSGQQASEQAVKD
jgi:putative methionine-R-sulfoxide reductase with GAF domain